jgi:hypothetical protein
MLPSLILALIIIICCLGWGYLYQISCVQSQSGGYFQSIISRIQWTRETPSPHLFQNIIRDPLTPFHQFGRLITQYGDPDVLDPSQLGLAVWKKDKLTQKESCLDRIIINDYPVNYLSIWILFPLKTTRGDCQTQSILRNISRINSQISYDQGNYMLILTGNRFEDLLALAVPTLRYLSGKVNLEQAKAIARQMLGTVNPQSKLYSKTAIAELETEICLTLNPQLR